MLSAKGMGAKAIMVLGNKTDLEVPNYRLESISDLSLIMSGRPGKRSIDC